MAAVRSADRRDLRRVTRRREPVVHRGANSPALDRRIAGTMVAGDQEDEPIASRDSLFQTAVDGPPRRVEIHPVQVENPVRLNRSGADPPVPAAVERGAQMRARRSRMCRARSADRRSFASRFRLVYRYFRLFLVTG